jgi:hypothetical protein
MENNNTEFRGLLTAALEQWPEEPEQAAAEPQPESNVIYLADYKRH